MPSSAYAPQPYGALPAYPTQDGPRAERVDAIPGTPFGIAYAAVPQIASGQAVGSMIAGIVSVLVAIIELAFGLGGAAAGWGPSVAGAFGILAFVLGVAAIVGGLFARRAIRRSAGVLHGLGLARTGLILGIVGVAAALLSFGASLLATYG
jgi:hypothetical protein